MRVTLVHVPKVVRVAGKPDALFAMAMPMGMLTLADELDGSGHEVEIIHAGVERQLDRRFELAAALAARPSELVGLSLHWHHQLAEVLTEAGAIRRVLPDATIVVGGMTASRFHHELLERCSAIDLVIRGEAELPLAELVRCLGAGERLTGVPNLSWREGDRITHNPLSWCADADALSQMCFTRRDLLRHADLYSGDPWLPLGGPPPSTGGSTFYLCVGRGCDWECSFCAGCRSGHRLFTGRSKPAVRTVDSVLDSFRQLVEQGVAAPFICFEPAAVTHSGYYLELFAALRYEMRARTKSSVAAVALAVTSATAAPVARPPRRSASRSTVP